MWHSKTNKDIHHTHTDMFYESVYTIHRLYAEQRCVQIKTNFPSMDGSLRGIADREAGKEMEESIPVLLWVCLTWHREALWVGSNNISSPLGVRRGPWTHAAFISGHSSRRRALSKRIEGWKESEVWLSHPIYVVCMLVIVFMWYICVPVALFEG